MTLAEVTRWFRRATGSGSSWSDLVDEEELLSHVPFMLCGDARRVVTAAALEASGHVCGRKRGHPGAHCDEQFAWNSGGVWLLTNQYERIGEASGLAEYL